MKKGLEDFAGGLKRSALWLTLAWNDLRRGNIRTRIGVLWHTISFFLVLSALGFIYSKIFGRPTEIYVPYLAAGFLAWRFVSLAATDALSVLTRNKGFLVQIPMPMSVFFFRSVCLHAFILGLNFAAYLLVISAFGVFPEPNLFQLGVCMVIYVTAAVGVTALLGIAAVFHRWLQNLIPPMINLLFFVTPIIWMPSMLLGTYGDPGGGASGFDTSLRSAIVVFNPLYHFIEVLRGPVVGYAPSVMSWVVASVLSAVLLGGAVLVVSRTKSRVLVSL